MCIYKCADGMQFMEGMSGKKCDEDFEEPEWAKPNSD